MPDIEITLPVALPDGGEVDVRLGISLAINAVRPLVAAPSGPSVRGVAVGNGATCSLPTNVAGDVLLCFGEYSNVVSAPSGWTQVLVQMESAGSGRLGVFKKVSTGGETEVPVSGSARVWTNYAIKDATDVDVSTSSGSDTGTTVTFQDVDPTTAPTLLIDAVIVENEDGATTVAMPAGETATAVVTATAQPYFLRTGYKSLAVDTPTGTRTGTVDAANGHAIATVVVK